ncbi:MAG: DnaJ domain-containing protein [Planctomycetota bacterium]
MGKKPAARSKAKTKPSAPAKARAYRTGKHTEALRVLSPYECNEFFERSPAERLCEIFEESYPAELVNVLLDLKKATVRRFFEMLRAERKRGLAELATLYYYKEYLTNPFPLRVEVEAGQSVPNYYAILGVPRDAGEEELKTAYRLLAKAYAPAAFPPEMRKSGAERLAEIEDAYEHLKNAKRRAAADRLLPNINYLYPRRDQTWLDAVERLVG